MRKLYILGLIGLAGIIIGFAWAEQMTFSTYYPAPHGVYREMNVNYLDFKNDVYDEDSGDMPEHEEARICYDSNGNVFKHSDGTNWNLLGGAWNHDGSELYRGVASTAWGELDTDIGSRALVFLKVSHVIGTAPNNNWKLRFRPADDSSDTYSGSLPYSGCASGQMTSFGDTNDPLYITVETNANGKIEWISDSATGFQVAIVLKGYIK